MKNSLFWSKPAQPLPSQIQNPDRIRIFQNGARKQTTKMTSHTRGLLARGWKLVNHHVLNSNRYWSDQNSGKQTLPMKSQCLKASKKPSGYIKSFFREWKFKIYTLICNIAYIKAGACRPTGIKRKLILSRVSSKNKSPERRSLQAQQPSEGGSLEFCFGPGRFFVYKFYLRSERKQ